MVVLQIAEKRRNVKGKGEKERYFHLNAEFQRIARRDKKAFLSDQCKEENNRMGKTRDLFKKIRDAKGIFHAKMGTMKERNGSKRSNGTKQCLSPGSWLSAPLDAKPLQSLASVHFSSATEMC